MTNVAQHIFLLVSNMINISANIKDIIVTVQICENTYNIDIAFFIHYRKTIYVYNHCNKPKKGKFQTHCCICFC